MRTACAGHGSYSFAENIDLKSLPEKIIYSIEQAS